MTQPVVNFSAGPSLLPAAIMPHIQADLVNFKGSGMGVAEISHRSPLWESRLAEIFGLLRTALRVPDSHEVLLIQGGATLQFSMVPLNLASPGARVDYLVTGRWAENAAKEAARVGRDPHVAARAFDAIPRDLDLSPDAAYVHYTSNNTVIGTEFFHIPEVGATPLVCDASSDILSRPFDIGAHALVYAGAQKNLGPAGLCVVIVRRDLLDGAADPVPTLLRYGVYAKNDSMYNTPPVLAIHMLGHVLSWVLEQGGAEEMERRAIARSSLLYSAIDALPHFQGNVATPDRSRMNVTFRLTDEALEERFIHEAEAAGFCFIRGHRSTGGVRVSLYNAMPLHDVQRFVHFMEDFSARA